MSYHIEKGTNDIVISGWEKGISPSPYQGIANMQAVNISTEMGEVMCSFARNNQAQTLITGTFTVPNTSPYTTLTTPTTGLLTGSWVTISNSTISTLTNTNSYYVLDGTPGAIKLSTTYATSSSSAISFSANVGNTANFTTSHTMGVALSYCVETYNDTNGIEYRYYILDKQGYIWIHDSSTLSVSGVPQPLWFQSNLTQTYASSIAVFNGWLFAFSGFNIYCKKTVTLESVFTLFALGKMITNGNHFAFVGHQNIIYYTDGYNISSIFPDNSTLTQVQNIQSFSLYTAVTTTGTISQIIEGSSPTTGITGSTVRIPVYFYATGAGASVPTAVTEGTTYYLLMTGNSTFNVYAAATGGSALDISTGAVGTQYFNTFYPISNGAGFGSDTINFTPQRVSLPINETAQCIAEIGNNILIGCAGNVVYPWNQIDPKTSDLIFLPESNVTSIITVNNMGYIFAGNKGNIYITNGSTASPVIKVPDYCAGIAGTPASYIEPYFVWGGTMYLRGRVYFSIEDFKTGSSTGNCGGVWSFVPTQNLFIGENTGLALRLENQSSYGTYSGYSTLLIPNQSQLGIAPQYWNAWQSTSAGSTYGIDYTGTTTLATIPAIIESDLIPVGTFFDKQTFKQVEYKLSTPLAVGESVAISYRQNSTSAYVTCGTAITENTTGLSGYFSSNFEKSQWLQLQIILTPLSTSSSTFCRLREIRIR